MKKVFINRVLPVFLSLIISVSVLVVPSHALGLGTITATEVMAALGAAVDTLTFWEYLEKFWTNPNSDRTDHMIHAQLVPGLIREGKYYETDYATLETLAHAWTDEYAYGGNPYIQYENNVWTAQPMALDGTEYWYVCIRRLDLEYRPGAALTHKDGAVILAKKTEDDVSTPRWVPRSTVSLQVWDMLGYPELYNLAQEYGGTLTESPAGDHWYIQKSNQSGTSIQVLVNTGGVPYACPKEKNSAAIEQDRPSTTIKDENGNEITIEGDDTDLDLDLTDKLLTIFGDVLNIDQLIYDEGTKTYFIDASKTDITNNITNNYYFKWEYHINYTSVTYIGQTEEYDKYYEVYYELPDGRDSADLTKEELEQLNVSVDVIPYERAADDTSLRSLYHFDGDTRDASYWNYCTDFAWKTGASLTYMDSGAFNGALYLDEKEHEFTITLPSAITAADFTLQFRYYQGYTAAAVNDTYISFGDTVVMRMNGTHLMKQTSTKMAEIPIGTWNEIAFMRKGKTHYWYLNGVCLASGTGFNGTTFEDTITFHFGSEQQTFKYLDELRFLDYSLVDGGANYVPGLAGLDYAWIAGAVFFGIVLGACFKLLGGLIRS